MNHDLVTFAVGVAMLLIGLFAADYITRPARRQKDTDHANWAAEARIAHTALIRAVERHARRATRAEVKADELADDLTWTQGEVARLHLEADQHAERHCCVPTLGGIRAEAAYNGEPLAEWERDMFKRPIDEPPLSLAARTAEVVPIKRGRA